MDQDRIRQIYDERAVVQGGYPAAGRLIGGCEPAGLWGGARRACYANRQVIHSADEYANQLAEQQHKFLSPAIANRLDAYDRAIARKEAMVSKASLEAAQLEALKQAELAKAQPSELEVREGRGRKVAKCPAQKPRKTKAKKKPMLKQEGQKAVLQAVEKSAKLAAELAAKEAIKSVKAKEKCPIKKKAAPRKSKLAATPGQQRKRVQVSPKKKLIR
jgi:hypothetical protein